MPIPPPIPVAQKYSYEFDAKFACLDEEGDLAQFVITLWMHGVPESWSSTTYAGSTAYQHPFGLAELWIAEMSIIHQLALDEMLVGWGEFGAHIEASNSGTFVEPQEADIGFA